MKPNLPQTTPTYPGPPQPTLDHPNLPQTTPTTAGLWPTPTMATPHPTPNPTPHPTPHPTPPSTQ